MELICEQEFFQRPVIQSSCACCSRVAFFSFNSAVLPDLSARQQIAIDRLASSNRLIRRLPPLNSSGGTCVAHSTRPLIDLGQTDSRDRAAWPGLANEQTVATIGVRMLSYKNKTTAHLWAPTLIESAKSDRCYNHV